MLTFTISSKLDNYILLRNNQLNIEVQQLELINQYIKRFNKYRKNQRISKPKIWKGIKTSSCLSFYFLTVLTAFSSSLFFSPSLQLHSGPVQCQTSHTGLSGQYLPQSIHIRCLLTLRPLCGHRGMRHKSCHQSLGARIAKWQSGAVQRRQCRCRVCRSQICRNMCGEYTERN